MMRRTRQILSSTFAILSVFTLNAQADLQLPLRHYYWIDQEQTHCGEFTNEDAFVRTLSTTRPCEEWDAPILRPGDEHFLLQKCTYTTGSRVRLPEEILEISNDHVLPHGALERYGSRVLGVALVQRLQAARDSRPLAHHGQNVWSDSEIQMAFHPAHIEVIHANGFLNQHQTHTSGGMNAPRIRSQVENRFIRMKLENTYSNEQAAPMHYLRPKYSYLAIRRPGMGPNQFTDQYGSIIAVMKNRIKSRTTFTPRDSLNYDVRTFGLHSLLTRLDNELIRQFYSFWEAQIWGEATRNDIDHFLVNCLGVGSISPSILERLSIFHKPVYQCLTSGSGWFYPGAPAQ